MRYQAYSNPGTVDEMESSAYVEIDRANPEIYCDCSNMPSLTRQEFADDCNINNLMATYEKTGVINHWNNTPPQYMDLTEVPDLQTALATMANANAAFMQLPAHVRREFDNDPIKFTEFATDKNNLDQMRAWGLAEPVPVEPPPQKVEIINPQSDAT